MDGLRRVLVLAVFVLFAGCSDDTEFQPDGGIDVGPSVVELIAGGCSTEVVRGLSLQIADEIACMDEGALVSFAPDDNIVFNSPAVLPFVSQAGLDDLRDAILAHGGELRINSGFRTVVQQYLLYQWFLDGRCGITAAATPGTSNHESGRALDIDNYQRWSTLLPDYGWSQTVLPNDPVHFDHLDSPDNRGLDVTAFQRLWNRNRPDDPIDEDGIYGAMTETRIGLSPSGGFALGADCPASLAVEVQPLLSIDHAPAAALCAH